MVFIFSIQYTPSDRFFFWLRSQPPGDSAAHARGLPPGRLALRALARAPPAALAVAPHRLRGGAAGCGRGGQGVAVGWSAAARRSLVAVRGRARWWWRRFLGVTAARGPPPPPVACSVSVPQARAPRFGMGGCDGAVQCKRAALKGLAPRRHTGAVRRSRSAGGRVAHGGDPQKRRRAGTYSPQSVCGGGPKGVKKKVPLLPFYVHWTRLAGKGGESTRQGNTRNRWRGPATTPPLAARKPRKVTSPRAKALK